LPSWEGFYAPLCFLSAMSQKRRLVILGVTGTVGKKAVAIVKESNLPMEIIAASAHTKGDAMANILPANTKQFLTSSAQGSNNLLTLLREGDYDICLNAVVGAAGLPYSATVLQAGRALGLANKESLVMAGHPLSAISKKTGGNIIPVDSEHSAIHQCLRGEDISTVRQIYLTASGGAFRDEPITALNSVTPKQALEHPNWTMGPRITVDSATMMNKALEIVEACHLFNISPEKIKIVLHRQSVAHSMVEFEDGSVMAQLGPPDMAFPIHYALNWPHRARFPRNGFDQKVFANLNFDNPSPERWPALELGWEAARAGGAAGAVLNGADEIAVEAFLAGDLEFLSIIDVCRQALRSMPELPLESIEDALKADAWAREYTRELISLPTQL